MQPDGESKAPESQPESTESGSIVDLITPSNAYSTMNGLICIVNDMMNQTNRGRGGRELSIAVTKLEEAQMWFNAALEAQGG